MSGIVRTSHSKSKIIGRSQDTAKAWVNWLETTHAIQTSFNVSSVGDNGTGQPTIHLTIPMKSINYIVAGIPFHSEGEVADGSFSLKSALTTTAIQLYRGDSGGDLYERPFKDSIIVFGD